MRTRTNARISASPVLVLYDWPTLTLRELVELVDGEPDLAGNLAGRLPKLALWPVLPLLAAARQQTLLMLRAMSRPCLPAAPQPQPRRLDATAELGRARRHLDPSAL